MKIPYIFRTLIHRGWRSFGVLFSGLCLSMILFRVGLPLSWSMAIGACMVHAVYLCLHRIWVTLLVGILGMSAAVFTIFLSDEHWLVYWLAYVQIGLAVLHSNWFFLLDNRSSIQRDSVGPRTP